jgi:Flp pilus assembly pilin Flp
LTTSIQFPNDELGPSRPSFDTDARPYRRRGYFLRSLRRTIDRLKAAVIEFALIAILIAGFIVAALFALDLSDMLRW